MPIRYKILSDLDLVVAHFFGEVGTEEHIASFLEYAAEPLFDGRQNVLVDMSRCTLEDAFFADMQRLAYRLKTYYEVRALTSKTSIYAPGDVVYGMSRMYQSISEATSPWKLDVFRDLDDALGYLGFGIGSPAARQVLASWKD